MVPWIYIQRHLYQYTEYVTRKYGDATVVFDGYEKTNTKDMTHQRRSKGNAGTMTFTADMVITMKKEQFLANRQNKQQFIFMHCRRRTARHTMLQEMLTSLSS
jgi:hypothetical protein